MTITIDQVEVSASEQLPDKFQTLLEMIPGGTYAFELLLGNQDERFSFNSAESFIEQLSLGIRNSSLVFVPNAQFIADIKKLSNLSSNALRDLSNLTCSSASQAKQSGMTVTKKKQLLQKYHLLDNDDFAEVNAFYKRNDLSSHSLIWAADFHDQITLHHTLAYCDQAFSCTNAQTKSACQWALSQAQNLSEFGHYYCLYLVWLQQKSAKSSSIDAVIQQLEPLVLKHLKCPTVTFELDPNTLNLAIVQWQELGNMVGFNSVSAGLLNIALNINLSNASQLTEQANEYIAELQKQLATSLATEQFVCQAGLARHYVIWIKDRSVVLTVTRDGCLSIFSDRPTKKKPATASNTGVSASKTGVSAPTSGAA